MSNTIYPYSILFIEDELEVRRNYCEYLRMFFTEVYEAEDGQEGYDRYISLSPDILIVDINLPKLSGIELIKKIRQKDHQVKAIMLTANYEVSTVIEAASLKLVKYLVKPVKRQELIEALYATIEELSSYRVRFKNIFEYTLYLARDIYPALEGKEKEEILKRVAQLSALVYVKKMSEERFKYEEISLSVWEYDEEGSINSIKSLVKKIRKKIPSNIIENVFATGFKINNFSRK